MTCTHFRFPGSCASHTSTKMTSEPNPYTDTLASKPESSFSTQCADSNTGDVGRELDHDINELARKLTTRSANQPLSSPFVAAEGSSLDPKSEKFRAKDWARAFYDLRYNSDDAVPRLAGLAFRDLNVWGKGSPTDFQSTVGNNILKLPSLFGRGTKKIEILKHLDGLILPGEQLCVLGPPGCVL